MKLRTSLFLLSFALEPLAASTQACGGPVLSKPLSTLSSCRTASAFCTKYLGGAGTVTRTEQTKTSTTLDRATRTVTVKTTSTTTFYTSTTSTSVTSYSGVTCGAPTTSNAKRDRTTAAVKRAPTRSCGFASGADPSRISAACNCFVAKTTTVTTIKTVTPKASTTTSTTTITRASLAVATNTAYSTCNTPPFTLQAAADALLFRTSDPSLSYTFSSNNISTFQISETGYLRDIDLNQRLVLVNYPFTGSTAKAASLDTESKYPGNSLPTCYLDPKSSTIKCTTPGTGSNPYSCLMQDSSGGIQRGVVFSSVSPNSGCFGITLSYLLP